jgi:hypothetical protein
LIDVQQEYFKPGSPAAFESASTILEDLDGRKVSHTEVMRSTSTALAAGFAEIVSTTDVLERWVSPDLAERAGRGRRSLACGRWWATKSSRRPLS